ncbi:TROVE domain-containing protein [Catenulispora subtropica]
MWQTDTFSQALQAGNYERGVGWVRDPKSELFLLAAANMVGQHTFYERAGSRDRRYVELIWEHALSDPEWTLGLLRWLRSEANMRTASLVGAAEFARARQQARRHGYSRQAIAAVLQRPDEPGELLAYWTSRYGRQLPMPVKRGVADAVQRLYTGRALLKYDTDSQAFRFGDVLELTHPAPAPDRPWQAAVFRYALDRRHRSASAAPPAGEELLQSHHALMAVPAEARYALVTDPGGAQRLAAAGMTWETLAGWLQRPLDAAVWEAVIPSMGTMALVRNLRNFDQAGIGEPAAAEVARRICDRDEVIRSRQFPFRYLAAYRHADSERWGAALETALAHSLANVPRLLGRTLVLVDRSGSMFFTPEARTELTRADSAAIFGTALALRGEHVDLVEFGTGSRRIEVGPQDTVLAALDRFHDLGGTETANAVRTHYQGHDRVIIITDEQAFRSDTSVLAPVPNEVPVYTWNLAGYAVGHAEPGPRRYTFGGLSDAAFRLIPLIEEGLETGWPWE